MLKLQYNSNYVSNLTTDASKYFWQKHIEYQPPGVVVREVAGAHDPVFKGLTARIVTEKEVKDVLSRNVFLEALGDVDVSKKVRRKVKELESSDFEYLVALMLAQAFDPIMLDEFEREPERVIVVEE